MRTTNSTYDYVLTYEAALSERSAPHTSPKIRKHHVTFTVPARINSADLDKIVGDLKDMHGVDGFVCAIAVTGVYLLNTTSN
jgi:hypothetical protein